MENGKINAAKEAVKYIKNNKVVGLGTGSTSSLFIRFLAERVRNEGLNLVFVASSKESERLAAENGLRVSDFNEIRKVDVYVDGADAVNSKLELVKGLGGALTREKVLAYKARKFICIVDESKVREFRDVVVPVEVLQFNYKQVTEQLIRLGATCSVRMKGDVIYVTDNGNYIVDSKFGEIQNPKKLEKKLKLVPGVVESGIFGKVSVVIVGNENGVRIMGRGL
ncbi:ribose-5-phosphate isomerase RpiA [Candidatus Micrarchaeota archaeon]|nr:ribose-5-phosphate isomerase RpiA [Candidatus Micrarchaeota archaeon]